MSITLRRRVRAAEQAVERAEPPRIRAIVRTLARPLGDNSEPMRFAADDRSWNREPDETYDAFVDRVVAEATAGKDGLVRILEQ